MKCTRFNFVDQADNMAAKVEHPTDVELLCCRLTSMHFVLLFVFPFFSFVDHIQFGPKLPPSHMKMAESTCELLRSPPRSYDDKR